MKTSIAPTKMLVQLGAVGRGATDRVEPRDPLVVWISAGKVVIQPLTALLALQRAATAHHKDQIEPVGNAVESVHAGTGEPDIGGRPTEEALLPFLDAAGTADGRL